MRSTRVARPTTSSCSRRREGRDGRGLPGSRGRGAPDGARAHAGSPAAACGLARAHALDRCRLCVRGGVAGARGGRGYTASIVFSHLDISPLRARRRATAVGFAAVLLWSLFIGFMRLVTQSFGPLLGAALIYTLVSVAMWIVRRPAPLSTYSPRYLLIAGGLFVATEVLTSQAIGLARTPAQAIEVSIVNYLWPTLIVVLSVFARRTRRPNALIVPGVLLATAGVASVVGGDAGLSFSSIAENVSSWPVPYALALMDAIAWSCYSVFSPGLSKGQDGLTLFFTAVAACMWALYFAAGCPALPAEVSFSGVLALLGSAGVIAAGYSCWNVGIEKGDMGALSIASYATPVLSSVASSVLLGQVPGMTFWAGVVAVAAGALLCWFSTGGLDILRGAMRGRKAGGGEER